MVSLAKLLNSLPLPYPIRFAICITYPSPQVPFHLPGSVEKLHLSTKMAIPLILPITDLSQSVLPIIMKVFERFIHDQIYHYTAVNNILCDQQSGFRPKHSTVTTLLSVQDYVVDNMQKGLLTGVVFLDLKKAFDTVSAPNLIQKLSDIGVAGTELTWFNDYMTHRIQIVKLNGITSESCPIKFGVPQGSILGPLLFITILK